MCELLLQAHENSNQENNFFFFHSFHFVPCQIKQHSSPELISSLVHNIHPLMCFVSLYYCLVSAGRTLK